MNAMFPDQTCKILRLAHEAEGGRLIEQCFLGEYDSASCATLGSTYKGQVCGLH